VVNSPDIVVVNDPYNGSFFIDIAVPPSNNTEIVKYMQNTWSLSLIISAIGNILNKESKIYKNVLHLTVH
jgi:hypothetical protein